MQRSQIEDLMASEHVKALIHCYIREKGFAGQENSLQVWLLLASVVGLKYLESVNCVSPNLLQAYVYRIILQLPTAPAEVKIKLEQLCCLNTETKRISDLYILLLEKHAFAESALLKQCATTWMFDLLMQLQTKPLRALETTSPKLSAVGDANETTLAPGPHTMSRPNSEENDVIANEAPDFLDGWEMISHSSPQEKEAERAYLEDIRNDCIQFITKLRNAIVALKEIEAREIDEMAKQAFEGTKQFSHPMTRALKQYYVMNKIFLILDTEKGQLGGLLDYIANDRDHSKTILQSPLPSSNLFDSMFKSAGHQFIIQLEEKLKNFAPYREEKKVFCNLL